MTKLSLGYREISHVEDSLFGDRGATLRGHEFHYSEIARGGNPGNDICRTYEMKDGRGRELPREGYRFKNTLASYVHVHFGSNPGAARNFVRLIREETWRI
jgi:cobyrinic acid a,c-diamide synthase